MTAALHRQVVNDPEVRRHRNPAAQQSLPYRGVLSFWSQALEALRSETGRVHHAARLRSGGMAVSRRPYNEYIP